MSCANRVRGLTLPKAGTGLDALVSHSEDPDLQKASQALLRASEKARQLADKPERHLPCVSPPLLYAKADKQK